jgi:HAD superfamily phosphoserine phosphatase-like hydrolase
VTAEASGHSADLAIFDVCGTLYDENTTAGFLSYYHSSAEHAWFPRLKRRWASRSSPCFYLGAAASRLVHWDIARERLVASLRGETRASLRGAARRYAAEVLPDRENPVLHERLDEHRRAGDRVVLVSNSLDIVIEAIAQRLEVEFRASRLGFSGEICDGRIVDDLTGRKAQTVRALAAEHEGAPTLHVFTDNESDRDIVELADRATVVIPKGRSASMWKGQRCETIRL